jgi:hypothetical protein
LYSNAVLDWRTLPGEAGSAEVLEDRTLGYWAYGEEQHFDWSLTGGVALELHADGVLRLLGTHAVFRAQGMGFEQVAKVEETVEIMSPRAEQVCDSVVDAVAVSVERALASWSEHLDAESKRH